MSLDLFRVVYGIDIENEALTSNANILQGIGAPGSETQTNDAPVGSIYLRTDAEADQLQFYYKHTAGAGTDKWHQGTSKEYVDAAVQGLSWRPPVRVLDETFYASLPAGGVVDVSH